ncbi:amidohydrolase/deacetylase family metallohydrolase [Gordoniibacillus kamchatkensis]|uniref:amidohydrolase/deacetylase family metallohydrolase n=1 Tax=Gordoniibacillus kamchatkensis TaxID=1590651 RepID=UPI00069642EB|nr:amidohydrolase/deacetylase family metallohydrolase [Paenibacillus sp. VKM B-2647]
MEALALAVKVIDPVRKTAFTARLEQTEDGFTLHRDNTAEAEPDLLLSPGWIDLHAHVYDGMTSISVPADEVGLRTGVHLIADAGSAGEATLPGFMKYVAHACETDIRAWLNISSIGLVHMREVAELTHIDVDRTIKAALDNRPFVCGIKVRSSGAIVGTMGLQPLQLAVLAAREAGLPLMVHIGEAPPRIDDVLDLLDEGDVVTHCFHGKTGHPWSREGSPGKALLRALERGVILDVGHGAASFSFDICRNALAKGLPAFSISTDVHVRNIGGPVYDLTTTMTKLLWCGLPLEDVIAGVTLVPASVLRLPDWCRLDGVLERATLFRIAGEPPRGRVYRDAKGEHVRPEKVILPQAVIAGKQLQWLTTP